MNKEAVELVRQHLGHNISDFVAGFSRWLNPRIESITDEGRVIVSVEVRDDMLNPMGIMHGGCIAGIVDEVMGLQLFLLNTGGPFVAISLSVDFLNKAKPGEQIIISPDITRIGKSVAHASCEIKSEDGRLIARASSNFSRIG